MKYVYMVRAGDNHYKIGVAHNVTKRVKALQTSNAQKIELIIARLVHDYSSVENGLHKVLKQLKTNGGREWFELTPSDALQICILLNNNPEIDLADQVLSHIKQNILNIVEDYEKLIDEKVKIPKEISKPKLAKPILKYPDDEALKRKAVEIFASEGTASTSLLQRRLSIGYGKAARIMDKLEKENYITRLNGNHKRELINV